MSTYTYIHTYKVYDHRAFVIFVMYLYIFIHIYYNTRREAYSMNTVRLINNTINPYNNHIIALGARETRAVHILVNNYIHSVHKEKG